MSHPSAFAVPPGLTLQVLAIDEYFTENYWIKKNKVIQNILMCFMALITKLLCIEIVQPNAVLSCLLKKTKQ